MSERLQIFNGALNLIGHKTMEQEWQDSPQGQACRQFYPNAFASLLNTAAWPFAYREAVLEPAFDSHTAEVVGIFDSPLDGLAIDPVDNTVYATNSDNDLFSIDLESGAPGTQVSLPAALAGVTRSIAHDEIDLLLATEHDLYHVDPATATASLRGQMFDPDGAENTVGLAASQDRWYVASKTKLYLLEPLTGTLTLIGEHGIRGLAGLVWSGRWLYGVSAHPDGDRSLYRINAYTAISTRAFRLDRALFTAHSLAWLNTNTVLVAHTAGAHTLHRMVLSRSRYNRDLYLRPPDFKRIWTWDENLPYSTDQVSGEFIPQGDYLRYQSRLSRFAVEQDLRLAYTRNVPLEETDELFQQILRVKIARQLAVRFGTEPRLRQEMRIEEELLLREAQDVTLTQRREPEEETAASVGRQPSTRGTRYPRRSY